MLRGDILGERSRLTPDRTALVYVPTKERISYGRLNERATACARAWIHHFGLRKGDRVAILANNRVEFIEAYFAAIKSGIVLVPLSTKLTASELAFILGDSGARMLIHASCAASAVRVLEQRMVLEHWVALDEPVVAQDQSYPRMRDAYLRQDLALPRVEPEDLCALLYTSGTTGHPKGVMIPQRMVSWNAYNTVVSWQLRDTDVSPVFMPLYHAGGLGVFVAPLFAIGGTIVLHDGFHAAEILRTVEKERCTVILGVPTVFWFLLRSDAFDTTDWSSVRWLISGGAPLPVKLVEAFRAKGLVLRQGYGLTEVGVNCFSMTNEEATLYAGAVGRPMMFTQARIETQRGEEAETDEVGELMLRGPHVSCGYWNHPEANAEVYDSEGWFRTGDLATRDRTGMVQIVGRRTDMYISGGVNVFPPEVEAEILRHDAVADVAVVGVPDAIWGETGVAFVLLRPGHRLDKQVLLQSLRQRLASYKIPKTIVFVASLPRTSYGKIRKRELREAYSNGQWEALNPTAAQEEETATAVA
jgi:fatty-acyl-CoA synthase